MEIEIRKMTHGDARLAAELEKECFSFPWSEDAILDELSNENAAFFSAYVDGRFAGHAGMITVLDEANVCNIAVSPDVRRNGVGRALTTALINECKDRGVSVLMLEVRAGNDGAIQMYKSLGFEKVGLRRGFYSRPREDGLLFNYYIKKDI